MKNVALSVLFLLRISKFVTTNRNPQWSLQKYLSFFVSFCSKKSFFHTETTARIPKNLFNKKWRKKFSHQRVRQFNFLISQCHHTMRPSLYTKQLCAASATSSCIVTTADALAGGNNSCTYLFLSLSLFFYSTFFPPVPFSFLLSYYTYPKII